MYDLYLKVTGFIAKILGWICMVFLVTMALACFAQVIIRNMGASVPWIEEVSRYSQVWLTFLGGAIAYKHGSLAAVELLKNKLKGRAHGVLELLIWALSVVFVYYMITGGFGLVSKMAKQITPALQISKGIIYAALPVGGCFMMLFSFEHLFDGIREIIGKKEATA